MKRALPTAKKSRVPLMNWTSFLGARGFAATHDGKTYEVAPAGAFWELNLDGENFYYGDANTAKAIAGHVAYGRHDPREDVKRTGIWFRPTNIPNELTALSDGEPLFITAEEDGTYTFRNDTESISAGSLEAAHEHSATESGTRHPRAYLRDWPKREGGRHHWQ